MLSAGTFGRISGFGCHPFSYSTVSLGKISLAVYRYWVSLGEKGEATFYAIDLI